MVYWSNVTAFNDDAGKLRMRMCLSQYLGCRPRSVLIRGSYPSGTPIWTRIGQKHISGHPFQNKNESMLEVRWVLGACLDEPYITEFLQQLPEGIRNPL